MKIIYSFSFKLSKVFWALNHILKSWSAISNKFDINLDVSSSIWSITASKYYFNELFMILHIKFCRTETNVIPPCLLGTLSLNQRILLILISFTTRSIISEVCLSLFDDIELLTCLDLGKNFEGFHQVAPFLCQLSPFYFLIQNIKTIR